MVHVVAHITKSKNGVARHFLLNVEQPVRGNRIFRVLRERVYILYSCNQRRIGRRIVDRERRIREDRLKDIYVVARERGHVGCGGEVKVHRIVEKPDIPVDNCLSLSFRVPCKTYTGGPIAFRRLVCRLIERKQALGGDIEILSLTRSSAPNRIVVVSKTEV